MRSIKLPGFVLLATLFVSANSPVLKAASFSFTNTLNGDADVRLFNFATTSTGVVGLSTTSYAGGGFSPVLSLFDLGNSGLLIGRDNGVDHPSGDATLSLSLAAGNYIVALTVFDNLAVGPRLSDGFLREGDNDFTRDLGAPGNTGSFLNVDGQPRTGNYNLVVNNVATASTFTAIPEPSSMLLAGLGILGAFARFRRSQG